MELRRLRYFVAVAEELHFGRAAQRVHIAQPPLSQQIRKLEDELGVELLQRNRRGVALTAAGEIFLEQSRLVLADVQRAVEIVQRAARGEIGQIEIGHAPPADLAVLPTLLSAFSRRHPDVRLTLRGLSGPALTAALREGKIRVAIVRLPLEAPDLRLRTVSRERLVVALPKKHRLARSRELFLRQLAGEPFILFPRHLSPRYHDQIVALCSEQGGFTLRVAQESETIQTTLALVAAGLGVSLQAESIRNVARSGVVYRPLAEATPIVETGLAFRPDDDSAVLAKFLAVAADAMDARPEAAPAIDLNRA